MLRRSIKKASLVHEEVEEKEVMEEDQGQPANIVINYNKLCDDIYIADWL